MVEIETLKQLVFYLFFPSNVYMYIARYTHVARYHKLTKLCVCVCYSVHNTDLLIYIEVNLVDVYRGECEIIKISGAFISTNYKGLINHNLIWKQIHVFYFGFHNFNCIYSNKLLRRWKIILSWKRKLSVRYSFSKTKQKANISV